MSASILENADKQIKQIDTLYIREEIKQFIAVNFKFTLYSSNYDSLWYLDESKQNIKIEDIIKISENPNNDGLFEVDADVDVIVKNKDLCEVTNGYFTWNHINGNFDCTRCKLTSLKGLPKTHNGYLYINSFG